MLVPGLAGKVFTHPGAGHFYYDPCLADYARHREKHDSHVLGNLGAANRTETAHASPADRLTRSDAQAIPTWPALPFWAVGREVFCP